MKKTFILLFLILSFLSCSSSFELSNDIVKQSYLIPDRSINLSDKKITWFVDLNSYMTWTEVNNIYLNNNNIELVDVWEFEMLWKLDISNNNIRFISDLQLPLTIRHLNLSHNNLTNLKGIEKFTKLKTLDISFNNLQESDIKLSWLDNLKYVNIEWNEIWLDMLTKFSQFNSTYLSNNKKPFSK